MIARGLVKRMPQLLTFGVISPRATLATPMVGKDRGLEFRLPEKREALDRAARDAQRRVPILPRRRFRESPPLTRLADRTLCPSRRSVSYGRSVHRDQPSPCQWPRWFAPRYSPREP